MINIPHLIEVALLILIAYLIGCVIGYLLRTKVFASGQTEAKAEAPAKPTPAKAAPAKTTASAKPAAKPATKPAAKPAAPAAAKTALPEKMSAPQDGKKDNLKLIKGIGPKIETKLNDMGTFHFEQIAAWNKSRIAEVNETLSFKGRIERERWIPQAKALAKKK